MQRTFIGQISQALEKKKVKLYGWIHEIRDQAKIKFIILRDASGIVQLVITKDKKFFEDIVKIPRESVLSIEGVVKSAKVTNPEVSIKDFEVSVEKYHVLSEADKKLPIQVVKGKEAADLSTRLDWRWIDLRKPPHILIFKVGTFMEAMMREYWLKKGFIQIHSPKLMAAPSESGAEVFTVDYFGRPAYLAQSPQFYKQMAMAAGFEKVFEFGPAFRADPSHTTRHNTEFTSIDLEMSFIKSHEDVMKLLEETTQYVIKNVKEKFGKEIKQVFGIDIVVPKLPFPRLTMKETLNLLKAKGYHSAKGDIDAEGEKLICEVVKKKFGHDFVFITDYPVSARPFYHMRYPDDKTLTKSFDILWNGMEIATGAQREHRYDVLKQQAIENKLDLKILEDYLNFFKYGCPPHGGFGLGHARFLELLLGLSNIREATLLSRDTQRLRP